MKKIFFICIGILSLMLPGCEKDIICGIENPYGIIEDVRWFTINTWQPGAWRSASDNWENESHGGFIPDNFLEPPYKGAWVIYLDGPEWSMFNNRERYEELCLEWGGRLDGNRIESKALANLPYFQIFHVVANHGIVGMDLITESDFDANHPAGSSLSDITVVGYEANVEPILNHQPVTPEDPFLITIPMNEITASTLPRIAPGIYIEINRNPDKAGTYVLQQYIYFADGKVVKRRFKRIWLEEHLAQQPEG